MSLILDALRKMEHERKARRQGGADIRPEVVSYRGRPQQARRKPVLPIAVALVIIVVGAGSLLLSRDRGGKSVTALQPSDRTLTAGAAADVRPSSPPPKTLPPEPAQAPPAPVVPQQQPALLRKNPAEEPSASPRETSNSANITISGIAWQDERSLRRAVINGALVGEGAEVAGVRVVEIKENRVRFSRDGQTFEVPYTSAFSPR